MLPVGLGGGEKKERQQGMKEMDEENGLRRVTCCAIMMVPVLTQQQIGVGNLSFSLPKHAVAVENESINVFQKVVEAIRCPEVQAARSVKSGHVLVCCDCTKG